MTREEQKYIKEASKALEGVIKKKSKAYGYKTISGMVYLFDGAFVYVALMSVFPVDFGKKITIKLCYKPHVLDEVFWDIFEVVEAIKMPKSFHVNGAFTVPLMEAGTWKVPVDNIDRIDDIFDSITIEMERQIDSLKQNVPDLESFIKHTKQERNGVFYSVLANVHQKQFSDALKLILSALDKKDTSPFLDSSGKSFYDYAKKYCEERL